MDSGTDTDIINDCIHHTHPMLIQSHALTSLQSCSSLFPLCSFLFALSQGQAMTWVTPLGLPVLQPYRKSSTHTVRTILQSITLSLDDDALPVSKQKQRTAFPPNFVHSLDATHMLMTAIRMRDKNITFAAVHDSYWTHAQDIPAMNVVCHTAVMCMI